MIEGFLEYLRHERNYAELTVREYGRDLEHFQSYFKTLDDSLSWETVDSDVVRGWMECMMDSRQSATSVNRRLSALRSFYKYAMMAGLVAGNPARTVKGPKKHKPLPQFLKESEIDELLQPEMWGERFEDFRARTLLLMLYSTGMRRAEIISLRDKDVSLARREVKVTGKRRKQRIIPLGQEMIDALTLYQQKRDEEIPVADDTEALFRNDKGKQMTDAQVYGMVKKYLSLVTTQKKRSPHVMRHSFATAMLNHDAKLGSVQKLLGHESLNTTQIYTHVTFEELKRTYSKAHPRETD